MRIVAAEERNRILGCYTAMTDQEFAEILDLGHETRGVEFKPPGPLSDRPLAARVVRAVLGMANRRDGGLVIIGVGEIGDELNPVGLTEEDLTTWNFDDVADRVAVYADPAVGFEQEVREYNGNQYMVLDIEEFTDIPVLCKRDYEGVLRSGACYVRSSRKPETSEIPTQTDMRELLELATDKAVTKRLTEYRRMGLIPDIPLAVTDQDRFDEQAGELR